MSVHDKISMDDVKKLCVEQSYYTRQEFLTKYLNNIKKLFDTSEAQSPTCYIFYAWPTSDNQDSEYWVQPFLVTLHDHLRKAGIITLIDIVDLDSFDNIDDFIEKSQTSDYIIFVGTDSLLEKIESNLSYIERYESRCASNKHVIDTHKYGHSRVLSIPMTDNLYSYFIRTFGNFYSELSHGYIAMLHYLFEKIYKDKINERVSDYTNLRISTSDFFIKISQEIIDTESKINYHHNLLAHIMSDSKYIITNTKRIMYHFHQIKETNINNELIKEIKLNNEQTKLDTKDCNNKLLYDNYGEQFQRPSICKNFIKREKLIKRINKYFEQSQENQNTILYICGLSGIGKSEQVKYHYLYPNKPYRFRIWFDANNTDNLYSQYIELAKLNGIKFNENNILKDQVILAKKWIESQNRFLLVYDNVINNQQIRDLLPQRGHHDIIITTRNNCWISCNKLKFNNKFGVMNMKESIELIHKIAGLQSETSNLKILIEKLGYMPLALTQAAAYIGETNSTIENYLKLYSEFQHILLNYKDLSNNPKHELAWTTFDHDLKEIEQKCPHAIIALKQVSWFNSEVIPGEILEKMVNCTDDYYVDLLWDDIKECFSEYSLMYITREKYEFTMHPIIRDIIRSKQTEIERNEILNKINETLLNIK